MPAKKLILWSGVLVNISALIGISVFCATTAVAGECGEYPDLALIPPSLNANPGTEYAEWTRSYQGMPSIERMANGRLWAAWTSGGSHEGPQNYIVLVTSTDDGETWSTPILTIDPPGNVMAFVPILWRDPNDHLWVFWNQGYGAWWDGRGGTWATAAQGAESANLRWGEVQRIADGWTGSKPTVLRTGDWVLPVFVIHAPSELAEENEYYRLGLTPCVVDALSHDLGPMKGANIYRSTDEGLTWSFHGQANRAVDVPASSTADFNPVAEFRESLIEHMVIERSDGTLWMLIRTSPGIGESVSSDGGRTWTPVKNSRIRHPLSRFFIRRLSSDRLVMVRHDPPDVTYPDDCDDCGEFNRSHLTAYVSDDDGRSWKGGLLLDERETVSYPDGIEAQNGSIYIIYDRNRYTDREVWMAVFTEKDVLDGSCVSEDCRLRVSVSKPGS